MKFRQRIAWLVIIAYLGATCGLFFYIFEINDTYNKYALDHYSQFHPNPRFLAEQQRKQNKPKMLQENWIQESKVNENDRHTFKTVKWQEMFSHLTDIPLAVWLLLLLLPYLQVFFMLLACTKPDPRQSLAMLWPGMFYLRFCHQRTTSVRKSKKRGKLKNEASFSNGNNVYNM